MWKLSVVWTMDFMSLAGKTCHYGLLLSFPIFLWFILMAETIQGNDEVSFLPSCPPEVDVPGQAKVLFDDFWKWRLQDSPEMATMLGINHYDELLDSLSLKSYQSRRIASKIFLHRTSCLLERLPVDGNTSVRDNLELLKEELTIFIDGLETKGFLFPVSRISGVQLDFPILISYMKTETENDYRKILSRYQKFSVQAEEIIELLNEGIRRNMTRHYHSMKGILDQFAQLQTPPERSKFYEPFLRMPQNISDDTRTSLQLEAKRLIEENILPAYRKIAEYLITTYMRELRDEIGVQSLPNGREYYHQCIRYYLSISLSPEEVHAIGLQEVRRINEDIDEVIRSLGLNVSRREFSEMLRLDPRNFHNTSEELLKEYMDLAFNKIPPMLPKILKYIPDAPLAIKPVPSTLTEGLYAYYLPGSKDGKNPGTFFLDVSRPHTMPRYLIIPLSLHETRPGHHLQFHYNKVAQASDDLPEFRKKISQAFLGRVPAAFPQHVAHLEGWGLYSEYLGEEMGLYKDPYNRYGRLTTEMLRACRLVVDTGLHALGWSREKAIKFMINNNIGYSTTLNENEVDRYITWPGQACAYKIGEMKIKMLRYKAEQVLGDDFDVREFHDVVLRSQGPLWFLNKQMNHYIEEMCQKNNKRCQSYHGNLSRRM